MGSKIDVLCLFGLKVKAIINRSHTDLIPVSRSIDHCRCKHSDASSHDKNFDVRQYSNPAVFISSLCSLVQVVMQVAR